MRGDAAWVSAIGDYSKGGPYRVTAVFLRRDGRWLWHTRGPSRSTSASFVRGGCLRNAQDPRCRADPRGLTGAGTARGAASCRSPTASTTAATCVAGERARTIGFEDGRFYANGWHITGEMGGSGRRR